MKSLSELADIYDRWATANEATAEEILARLDSLPDDVRKQQRWRADQLVADAVALKIQLRNYETLIVAWSTSAQMVTKFRRIRIQAAMADKQPGIINASDRSHLRVVAHCQERQAQISYCMTALVLYRLEKVRTFNGCS